MDFNKLEDTQIEKLILHDADLTTLYELQIFIDRKKSNLFEELNVEKNPQTRSALKKTLSWTETVLDVCKKRQYDLRESNETFNWRFRAAAHKLLPAEMYDKIASKAKQTGTIN